MPCKSLFFFIPDNDVISLEFGPLNFRVFVHAHSPATADVFPFVANTRTKSIQKQKK